MKKLKMSFYGYHKESVRKYLRELQDIHQNKKQSLEAEYRIIQNDIDKLEESIHSKREGGQDT